VQIVLFAASSRVDPVGIVPVLAPAAVPEVRVTVFPLDVTEVVGVRVVVVGVLVVVVVLEVVVFEAEVVVGAVFGFVAAGTSVSAGCAAESPFASWMSLLRAESAAAVLSFFTEHAPANSASDNTSDAFNRGIYWNIKPPPSCDVAWVCPGS
jgi:hypothetical protein